MTTTCLVLIHCWMFELSDRRAPHLNQNRAAWARVGGFCLEVSCLARGAGDTAAKMKFNDKRHKTVGYIKGTVKTAAVYWGCMKWEFTAVFLFIFTVHLSSNPWDLHSVYNNNVAQSCWPGAVAVRENGAAGTGPFHQPVTFTTNTDTRFEILSVHLVIQHILFLKHFLKNCMVLYLKLDSVEMRGNGGGREMGNDTQPRFPIGLGGVVSSRPSHCSHTSVAEVFQNTQMKARALNYNFLGWPFDMHKHCCVFMTHIWCFILMFIVPSLLCDTDLYWTYTVNEFVVIYGSPF